MHVLLLTLIYLMFFLSGAAALMYEVVWVRSLSLVFGGTHLAVTAVLSVFMGGLALGSYFIGRRVDDVEKPLRLYGYLEFGIALAAASFILLMKIYPSVYAYLAQGKDHSIFYLSFIRVVFTGLVLIVPTTLMGGTLPLLTRFVSGHHEKMGTHLSLLYGFNTLGAVAGTAAAGFFFLRFYSVSATLYTAIAINSVIGLVSILLHEKVSAVLARREAGVEHDGQAFPQKSPDYSSEANASANLISYRLVLLGIGISGFCALGYEVLWTRILTLTIGTSVYGFTIMLVAFLTGIALGSETYGLFPKLFPDRAGETRTHVIGFGIVQFLIGAAALFVTFHIRDLPLHSTALRGFFLSGGFSSFESRQWANISLAFAYMIVPAFFMGLAFPLAGKVQGAYRKKIGHAVGDVLTFNTVGAIFGSAVSGFVMIYLFGIERSLQILTVINIGFGLLVIVSLKNYRVLNWTVGGLTLAFGAFLIVNQDA
ncbi:MAG: fused MFS/spermidine synthase, partial [Nitrospirota bacterium]|nr:fused MFS/spermidine synthase [Nitrospirota bacterium]